MAHRMVALGQIHHGRMINGGKFGMAKIKRLAKKKRIKKRMKGRRR